MISTMMMKNATTPHCHGQRRRWVACKRKLPKRREESSGGAPWTISMMTMRMNPTTPHSVQRTRPTTRPRLLLKDPILLPLPFLHEPEVCWKILQRRIHLISSNNTLPLMRMIKPWLLDQSWRAIVSIPLQRQKQTTIPCIRRTKAMTMTTKTTAPTRKTKLHRQYPKMTIVFWTRRQKWQLWWEPTSHQCRQQHPRNSPPKILVRRRQQQLKRKSKTRSLGNSKCQWPLTS
mmetsp:Transcript_27583/g.67087  ORF Transcript_27583/g.67087 Transcript_27583/m.67087 type:complete len:232 (+) Transcript_27583:1319-2014(+)